MRKTNPKRMGRLTQLTIVRIFLREAVFIELSKFPLSLEVGSSGTMHGPKTEQRLEVRGLIPLFVVLNLKKMNTFRTRMKPQTRRYFSLK